MVSFGLKSGWKRLERENDMKRHRPLKVMSYKAMPPVSGTERKTAWWTWLLITLGFLIVVYLFVSFLVGIVVLTNWLIC